MPRSTRTTNSQYNIYVDFLSAHDKFRNGKINPQNKDEIEELWKSLCLQLNSEGTGPNKNVEGWKKCFTEWKSQLKKKARMGKPLSTVEQKYLTVTGAVIIDGFGNEELGMPEETIEQAIIVTVPVATAEGNEIIIDQAPNLTAKEPKETQEIPIEQAKKKPKQTSNVLLDEYKKQQEETKEKMKGIAEGLFAIAASINRYCDIIENKNE